MRRNFAWRVIDRFWYNFGWHKISAYANNTFSRATIVIPIVGYLIIFNDQITSYLTFNRITAEENLFILSSVVRLRFVFFGLFIVALGTAYYRIRRPKILRLADNVNDYISYGIENFTVGSLVAVFGAVETDPRSPLTRDWDFDDSHLNGFVDAAIGNKIARSRGDSAFIAEGKYRFKVDSRSEAIDRHSEFVRSLLSEHFALRDRVRKFELFLLTIVLLIGYLALLVPSLDLFIAVLRASFIG